MPNQSSKTKTLTVRIRNNTYEAIESRARFYGITRNDYAKHLLEFAERGADESEDSVEHALTGTETDG